MKRYLKINEADDVAIALDDLSAGEVIEVDGKQVTLAEDVAKGHKVALHAIAEGENVIKYGYPIGHAICPIAEGEWIWTENGEEDYEQYWLCSCCHEKSYIEEKYCPNCGAKMKGGAE